MWSPTHVQVVVQKARNLPIKGKNGTNDAFVTIQLGKEKFQTSTKEKAENPEWNEECELTIPDGNTSCIVLSVLHRNFVGLDKFLGQVQILLNELDVYERARSRWYTLENKPGKPSTKKRGELEVRLSFTVKSVTGSLMDLSKKPKKTNSLPLKMVHNVGGSLMNLAGKEKKPHLPFKSIANYGHKLSEKFPLKKSSKSEKLEAKITEHDMEPEHDDDQSSHLSAFDSDDEQFNFGFEQLSDDFVIPASDYAPDSPLARQHSVNHSTEDIAEPLRESAAVLPSEPPTKSVFVERDEWQSKLLGNQMPESGDRRRSVPSLPLVQESPLESNSITTEDVPPPVPAKPRERPHKLRLEKNNMRRHTVEGIKLVLPDAPKTAPPKPPPPKLKPEGSSHNTENDTKPSNQNNVPSNVGTITSSLAVTSARQQGPVPVPRTQSMNIPVSKTLTPSAAPTATSAPTATTVTTTSNNIVNSNSNDVRSPTTNTKPKIDNEKLQVASSKLLSSLPKDKVEMFEKMSKEDMVELIVCQQSSIDKHLRQIHDLEDYIDGLLVRVMETTPRLLQNPYKLSSSIRNELGVDENKPKMVRPCNYL